MKIKLMTGHEYDLTQINDVKNLKARINVFKNQGHQDRLEYIYRQVEPYKNYEDDNVGFQKAKIIHDILIQKISSLQTPPVQNADAGAIVDIPNVDTVESDIERLKATTGQEQFVQFAYHLIFDLEDFKSKEEYVIWYMAIALNLYMHNASHKPMPGYGKAQKLEEDHALFYSRSQSKHPIRTRFDHFTKTASDVRPTSVLPLNPDFRKILSSAIEPVEDDTENKKAKSLQNKRKNIIRNLNLIDARRGFPCGDQKIPDYFSLFLAHSGMRVSNLRAFSNALEDVAANDEQIPVKNLKDKFKGEFPKKIPKNILKLQPEEVTKRIKELQYRFNLLKEKAKQLETSSDLQTKMQQHRTVNNKDICTRATAMLEKLDNQASSLLTVQSMGESCIVIRLNSNKFKFHEVGTKSYDEHANNVILGFFLGLLNYHARQKSLTLHVERRQSFGFLRPTVTDIDNLGIRLSLGLEPTEFNEVVLDSIRDLHKVLAARQHFPTNVIKMKSEKKQWQAGFEAQHYLQIAAQIDQQNYLETAFDNYLQEFAVANKSLVTDYASYSKLDGKPTKAAPNNFAKTPLFALLQNTLKYALDVAASFNLYQQNDELSHFQHSYWHSLLKLYQHCNAAVTLLENLGSYEITQAYALANTHVEDILEYLIAIDGLAQIQAKMQGQEPIRAKQLGVTEKNYALANFGLDPQQVDVYFVDSGQQAIVTSLLAMDLQLLLAGKHENQGQQSIYNFNQSYFELGLFLDDIGGLKNTDKKSATIAFIDVTQLYQMKFEDFTNLEALIIDTTRQPNLNDAKLKAIITEAHEQGKWVILAASCLKHEELGLDKYLAGKIIVLGPNADTKLQQETVKIFTSVASSFHPATASFLQMVNEICHKKCAAHNLLLTKNESQGLHHFGMWTNKQVITQPSVTPDLYSAVAASPRLE